MKETLFALSGVQVYLAEPEKETKKEESERLYAQLADAAIRQQVSHETLERRGTQVEGLLIPMA